MRNKGKVKKRESREDVLSKGKEKQKERQITLEVDESPILPP